MKKPDRALRRQCSSTGLDITTEENPANTKLCGLSQAAYFPNIHAHSMDTRLGMVMVAIRQGVDRAYSGADPQTYSLSQATHKKFRATHTQTLAVCLPPGALSSPGAPASHKKNSQPLAH
jgi:hypothetical protein